MKTTPTRTTTRRVHHLTTKGITRRRLGNSPERVLGLDQLGDQVLIASPGPTATATTSTLNRSKEFWAVHGNIVTAPDLNQVACGTSTHLTRTTTALIVRASPRRRCNGMIFVVGHCYSSIEILGAYALERMFAFFARARSVALRPDAFSPWDLRTRLSAFAEGPARRVRRRPAVVGVMCILF